MNPPHRRWSRFTLRRLFAVVAVCGLLLGFLVNLNWLYQRAYAVDKMRVPVEGEKAAPWPLRLVGARGFARIRVEVPAEEVAEWQEQARRGVLQVQKIFPEAEVIVKAKAN